MALHLYAGSGYGLFRDELYFIVCGRHPAFGYVDQPPLIPLIAAASYWLFDGSTRLLRLFPALAHGALILATAATAGQLGGRRFARLLTALTVWTGPVYQAQGTILFTDAVQPLTWLLCAYAAIRATRGEPRWWFVAGAIAGVGLLTKYMLAFWLVALALGLAATPARRAFARRELWLGVALAAVLVAPNVAWQAAHGFPFLEIGKVAANGKNLAFGPLGYLVREVREVNAANALVAACGFAAFTAWPRFTDLRWLPVAVVALLGAMIVSHGKSYYPVGAWPVFFAGGAVAIEAWSVRLPVGKMILAVLVVANGALAAPFAVPLLPIETFQRYQAFLGVQPENAERYRLGPLPELYADMFGWPELAAAVDRIYRNLPEAERPKAVFWGRNYGEAAAVEVLGAPVPAISGHNNFGIWGPRGFDGSVVIRFGGSREALLRAYDSVEPAAVFDAPLAVPYERGQTIWLCRRRKVPFDVAWPSLRHYD